MPCKVLELTQHRWYVVRGTWYVVRGTWYVGPTDGGTAPHDLSRAPAQLSNNPYGCHFTPLYILRLSTRQLILETLPLLLCV